MALRHGFSFQSDGSPMVIDLSVKSGTAASPDHLHRPCCAGRQAWGGIIKIFHRCSIPLRPGSKKPKASISRKLGRARLEKVAGSETGERIAKLGEEKASGNSGGRKWAGIEKVIGTFEVKVKVCPEGEAKRIIRSVRPNLCFPFTTPLPPFFHSFL